MVGVPGRSKGCATCRQRKKKCDLGRPTCGNCGKAKLACGGYERDIVVVQFDKGPGRAKYTPFKSKSQHDVTKSTGADIFKPQMVHGNSGNDIVVIENDDGPDQVGYVPSKADGHHVVAIHPCCLLDVSTRDLNLRAKDIQLFDAFWTIYLPAPSLVGVHAGPDPVEHWARLTQGMTPGSNMIRCALLALSTYKLGLSKNDTALVQQGMLLYGKSLSQVARHLERPSKMDHLELLWTCRLLALYEQMDGSNTAPRSWSTHIAGLVRLIQLRPPECYAQPGYHEAFIEARYNALVAGLAARKGTFMGTQEWVTKPWEGYVKTPTDNITEILLCLPAVFEELDAVVAAGGEREREREMEVRARERAMVQNCLDLKHRLSSWYDALCDSLQSELDPNDIQCLRRGRGYAPPLELPAALVRYGLGLAYSLALYWTASALVCTTLKTISTLRQGPSLHGAPSFRELVHPKYDPSAYCWCILEMARTWGRMGTQLGLLGVSCDLRMGFPLGIVHSLTGPPIDAVGHRSLPPAASRHQSVKPRSRVDRCEAPSWPPSAGPAVNGDGSQRRSVFNLCVDQGYRRLLVKPHGCVPAQTFPSPPLSTEPGP